MQFYTSTTATPDSLATGSNIGMQNAANGVSAHSSSQIGAAGSSSNTGNSITIGSYSEQNSTSQSIGANGAEYSKASTVDVGGVTCGSSDAVGVDASGVHLSESVTCCNTSCNFELNCCDPTPVAACCFSFFSAVTPCLATTADVGCQVLSCVGEVASCLLGGN